MRTPLVLAVLLLAGCSSPSSFQESEPRGPIPEPQSTVSVAAPEGVRRIPGERGAIQGVVVNLNGSAVAGVRIELVGVATVATTDNLGMYLVDSLAPGDYLLHARHDAYVQASAHVAVVAGSTTTADVRLAPLVATEPSFIDFWQGRNRVPVADGAYAGSDSVPPASHCLAGSKTRWGPMPTLRFDEPRQLVWPGTSEMVIVLDWDEDSFRGDRLAVVWRNHPDAAYELTSFASRGEPIRIALTPEQADFPRQAYTRWELGICSRDNSGSPAQAASTFNGAVHAQIDLVRGHPLPPWTPEPTLWSNGARFPVLNASSSFDAFDPTLWIVQPCSGPTAQIDGLTARAEWFKFVPSQGLLVPPGTTAIEATLSWTTTDVWGSPALDLAYRSAAIPPWIPDDASTHTALDPVESGPGLRSYRFEIGSLDADGWEDARSAWSFYWSLENTQHACLEMQVQLQVHALRDT